MHAYAAFRRKLWLCGSATIALLLGVLTAICFSFFERSARFWEYDAFHSTMAAISEDLLTQVVVSHSFLRQTEQTQSLVLGLYDRGEALYYNGTDETRQVLLDRATELAMEQQLDVRASVTSRRTILQKEFTLQWNGQTYLCQASVIPKEGKALGLIAVHSLAPFRSRILRFLLVFASSDLLVLILLSGLFSFLIRQMTAPMEQSALRQSEFVSAASHELRSPLTVLGMQIRSAKAGDIPTNGHFFDSLLEECSRLVRLTDQLLVLSRSDVRAMELKKTRTALDTLLLNLSESYELTAQRKDIRLSVQVPEDPIPFCLCDPDHIYQVLLILLDNAISYTPAGGSITLKLEPVYGGSFHIQVTDSGPGIPDALKTRIFERFYRADPSRTDKRHFGLGLSIAMQIVTAHHGRLFVTDPPAGGAAFHVQLPQHPVLFEKR